LPGFECAWETRPRVAAKNPSSTEEFNPQTNQPPNLLGEGWKVTAIRTTILNMPEDQTITFLTQQKRELKEIAREWGRPKCVGPTSVQQNCADLDPSNKRNSTKGGKKSKNRALCHRKIRIVSPVINHPPPSKLLESRKNEIDGRREIRKRKTRFDSGNLGGKEKINKKGKGRKNIYNSKGVTRSRGWVGYWGTSNGEQVQGKTNSIDVRILNASPVTRQFHGGQESESLTLPGGGEKGTMEKDGANRHFFSTSFRARTGRVKGQLIHCRKRNHGRVGSWL